MSLFGLDNDGSSSAATPAQPPRYTTKLKALMPLTSPWHAVYRHDPADPDELALIPVIGIATVEVIDLTTPSTSSIVFRPFVMMPSGTITDAASISGFVCLVSDDQNPDVSQEHIEGTVGAIDATDSET